MQEFMVYCDDTGTFKNKETTYDMKYFLAIVKYYHLSINIHPQFLLKYSLIHWINYPFIAMDKKSIQEGMIGPNKFL